MTEGLSRLTLFHTLFKNRRTVPTSVFEFTAQERKSDLSPKLHSGRPSVQQHSTFVRTPHLTCLLSHIHRKWVSAGWKLTKYVSLQCVTSLWKLRWRERLFPALNDRFNKGPNQTNKQFFTFFNEKMTTEVCLRQTYCILTLSLFYMASISGAGTALHTVHNTYLRDLQLVFKRLNSWIQSNIWALLFHRRNKPVTFSVCHLYTESMIQFPARKTAVHISDTSITWQSTSPAWHRCNLGRELNADISLQTRSQPAFGSGVGAGAERRGRRRSAI